MRIAHVSDCYLPRTGGIETQVRALALQQQARGDDVVVITATPDGRPSGSRVLDGLRVERISMRTPGDLPIHVRGGAHLRRTLAAVDPEVVHVHVGVVSPFAWSAVRAACRLGLPTVVTVHCIWGPIAGVAYRLSDMLLHWSRWGAVLSAVSRVAALRVERVVRGSGRVDVVPNGIDRHEWPTSVPVAHTPLVAVSVMRLAPRKRLGALMAILARAGAELAAGSVSDGAAPCSLRAIIVGDGPQRIRAVERARRKGLPITFTGRLSADEIRRIFSGADLFVQPSVKEAFGLAALEARTCGLPVLIRSASGSTEFVRDGVEGFVAASDDEMVRVIVEAARHPEMLEPVRAHNMTTAPRSTWPGVLRQLDEVYRRAATRCLGERD